MNVGFKKGNREQRANLARANLVCRANCIDSQATLSESGCARHAGDRAGRVVRGLLALALGVSIFASALFVALESNHECSGDACPVCHVLHATENAMMQTGVPSAAVASQAHVPLLLLLLTGVVCRFQCSTTLVDLKVRLDV